MIDKKDVIITLNLSEIEVEVLAYILTLSDCVADYIGSEELLGTYCSNQPGCEDCVLCNLLGTLRQLKKHPEADRVEYKPGITIERIRGGE